MPYVGYLYVEVTALVKPLINYVDSAVSVASTSWYRTLLPQATQLQDFIKHTYLSIFPVRYRFSVVFLHTSDCFLWQHMLC